MKRDKYPKSQLLAQPLHISDYIIWTN